MIKYICMLLLIILVCILIRAFTNKGKLWDKEHYGNKPGCASHTECNTGFYCDLQTHTPPHGQCKKI